ncbi:MAG: DUF3829 domain-containing protein [Burkholderiaceae bacterium]|nr:DUF3829 domain-containing protein [Burkholderiaceae bacterium]
MTAILVLTACSTEEDRLATSQKYDAYVEGFNSLQIHKLEEARDEWHRLSLAKGLDLARPYRSVAEHEWKAAVESLKIGRSIDARTTRRADDAADLLIEHLEPLHEHMTEMDAYFESGTHLEDGLARARAADPAVRAAYNGAVAAMQEMRVALTEYETKRDEAQAEQYRSQGDLVGYYMIVTRLHAADLVRKVSAGDTSGADHAARQVERSLMALRVEHAKQPDERGASIRIVQSGYGAMLSHYQTLKRYRQPFTTQLMVSAYNLTVMQTGWTP